MPPDPVNDNIGGRAAKLGHSLPVRQSLTANRAAQPQISYVPRIAYWSIHIMTTPTAIQTPRKANECFTGPKRSIEARPMFDEFWRKGELALMFGAAGTGKSVLAVQIADALARGKPLAGFRMPTSREKVLYVDLNLRDSQFKSRYSIAGKEPKRYKFAERLYRDRPPANADLVDWLREMVKANGFSAVVIDDLSAVKTSHDGTTETLKIMRRLRQLGDGLDISILVLAESDEPGRKGLVSTTDLGRSRVLCGVADSVFAIGSQMNKTYDRYIIQRRSRGAAMFWTERNGPVARIERLESGMLGFVFDGRFEAKMDDAEVQLIRRIRSMYDAGRTFRGIAETLDISKTRVYRLYRKWTPAMEPAKPKAPPEPIFYGLDKCIYTGCMNCDFCGGRRGNNRRSAGSNINGHKDCPDDCDLCGPRPYAADDTTADPKLKELSDKFHAELREWLLAGKPGERPQYPGAKRYGVRQACWFPGSEDWTEAELREYTYWKVQGYTDHGAAAQALRHRRTSVTDVRSPARQASPLIIPAEPPRAIETGQMSEPGALATGHFFNPKSKIQDPKSLVALRSPKRDQGSGQVVGHLPARLASPRIIEA